MMTRILAAVAIMLGLAVLVQTVHGEPSTSTVPTSQVMEVTITGVEGMVQVRDTSDKPWRKALVGMTVSEGAEFRTGPKSAVRVLIPPDQTITLDRLGVVKLMQAIRDGNKVKTKVGMPYGRTRYDIEEAGIEHQSELVSPSSTLAIRGTKVSIYDQPPFAPSAVSLTGTAIYTTAKRQMSFGGKGQGKTDVSSQTDSAAQYSLLQTYVDPNSHFGRPEADQKLINQLQAKGDIVLNNGQLAIATGPAVSDKQLSDLISGQGRFNISLRWFGPGDFDLFVLTNDIKTGAPYTLGNPSYKGSVFKDVGLFNGDNGIAPVTAAKTPDGGQIKFDQVAIGGGGIELASWNTPVPQVGYTIAIVYYDQRGKIANYPVRQTFRVDAFLDGKSVPVLTNGDDLFRQTATSLIFGPTYTGTASLIPSEQVLQPSDPTKLHGDIRVSAVDLSVDAVGNINPPDSTDTAAVARHVSKHRTPVQPAIFGLPVLATSVAPASVNNPPPTRVMGPVAAKAVKAK
jgi:hypothetical protein